MARTFTVTQLITRAQQRADMESSSFISDAEWKTMLSTIYGEFYGILAESGMRYYESEDTVTTDGSSTYALPADHLATVGVDYLSGSTQRRDLAQFMAQERNVFSSQQGASEALAYALIGSNIKLYPTPPSGQTYYHVYVPQPTDLSSADDADNVDVVTPDGESFITWGLSVLALSKEESDVRGAVMERERARERVQNWAALRAMHTPRRRIVDDSGGLYRAGYEEGDWEY